MIPRGELGVSKVRALAMGAAAVLASLALSPAANAAAVSGSKDMTPSSLKCATLVFQTSKQFGTWNYKTNILVNNNVWGIYPLRQDRRAIQFDINVFRRDITNWW